MKSLGKEQCMRRLVGSALDPRQLLERCRACFLSVTEMGSTVFKCRSPAIGLPLYAHFALAPIANVGLLVLIFPFQPARPSAASRL
jgi:hypothetical protein